MAAGIMSLLVAQASYGATSLNLNFGANESTMQSTGQAGLTGTESGNSLGSTTSSNWNNLANASGSSSSLLYSSGSSATGVSVSWSSSNTFALPDTNSGSNSTADRDMMKGYIEAQNGNSVSITVSGLSFPAAYSVVVYFDGANAYTWRKASYAIGGASYIGEDTENTDFNSGSGSNPNGVYQLPVAGGTGNGAWPSSPNNAEGNFFIFSGVSGESFTLTATPTEAGPSGGLLRAPINGIQIISVPEPHAAMLWMLGMVFAGAGVFRRKRVES